MIRPILPFDELATPAAFLKFFFEVTLAVFGDVAAGEDVRDGDA